MSILSGKNILLGISAGIAAYKTASLVRLFIKAGVRVKVVMTPASKDFVTPLTLSTLSKNPVYYQFTQDKDNELWTNHVDLGLWADLFVIAPATANTLSKLASGTSDNLLIATYLSAKSPVYIAPAMDLDMYQHPSTKQSLKTLEDFGNVIIPATSGELASGLIGEGRMAEPESIVAFLEADILKKLPLHNKQLLITAGPTYEAIDPVRYIGNHSSGKMGFALAQASANLGARVTLITGPTSEKIEHNLINVISVISAEEMYTAVHQYYKNTDIGIFSAAVSDYKPKKVSNHKIKKADNTLTITLERTKDILASVGELKNTKQYLVGFALETENELENAKSKLKAKNLDMIVLNSLNDTGAGFKTNTNKVLLITKSTKTEVPLQSKTEVAKRILEAIIKQYHA